jgi:hypothetical protein
VPEERLLHSEECCRGQGTRMIRTLSVTRPS